MLESQLRFHFLLLVKPIASLVLIAISFRAGRQALLPMLGILLLFCGLSYAIFRNHALVRAEIRWWSARKTWKDRVLAEAAGPGQLQHLDWDGWGFAGAGDTEVYLVYDPTDRLGTATRLANGEHSNALPCDVWKFWRLEPHWYNVVFYTDTSWDDCSADH